MTTEYELEVARATAREVASRLSGIELLATEWTIQAALVQVAIERAVDGGPAAGHRFAMFLRVMAGMAEHAANTKARTGITPKISEPVRVN